LKILQKAVVGGKEAQNRVFMAPLTRNRCQKNNVPTPIMQTYYKQRATAGLIISEGTAIHPRGIGYINIPGIYNKAQVEAWKPIVDAVHKKGGLFYCQLWHVGRQSHSSFHNGDLSLAPSAIAVKKRMLTYEGKAECEVPKAMSLDEINDTVNQYKNAAKYAIEAGFDGVELHGANGYLIDQFICESTNHRKDEYGGSIEKRSRFALEVVETVANEIGNNKTAIRLSPSGIFGDMKNENPKEAFKYIVEKLNDYNLAYLHIMEPFVELTDEYANYLQHGEVTPFFRKIYKGFLVSNVSYTPESAEKAIENGICDAVAFGKLFVSNPDLPLRIAKKSTLNDWDPASFYVGGEKGYIDYPNMLD